MLAYDTAVTGECTSSDGGLLGAQYFAAVQLKTGALPLAFTSGSRAATYTIVARPVANCTAAAQIEALNQLVLADKAHFILGSQSQQGLEVSQAANSLQRLLYHCCLVDDNESEKVRGVTPSVIHPLALTAGTR